MVQVAIIGGRLQGTEAAYLAKKAGFYSILIDKDENPPAKGLCDAFLKLDVREESTCLVEALASCDFILPTTENADALSALRRLQVAHKLNMAFDFDAYAVTVSKLCSDALFREHAIPAPRYYPAGQAPYIAKHAASSGSVGVRLLGADEALRLTDDADLVVQEYLEGPAYSIEVIGSPGRYTTYQVTEIHVDKDYDCCLVTCPCPAAQVAAFSETAVKIAELLQLRGIMDVEAILHEGQMKVLEIDARLPSQTPAAVLHSTGVNLLSELHRLFCGDWTQDSGPARFAHERAAAYEHIAATVNSVCAHGEGLMSGTSPLSLHQGLFGADEVLTDYRPGDREIRATLINSAESAARLEQKRQDALRAISAAMQL